MPCDTIQKAIVELKNVNAKTLEAMFRKMGLYVQVTNGVIFFSGRIDRTNVEGYYEKGKLVFPNGSHKKVVPFIKKAYSTYVVEEEAKKMAWQIKKIKEGRYLATKKYSNDKIDIEILEEGTIKTTTDKISAANHASAELFLLNMAREVGGEVTRVRKTSVSTIKPAQFESQ